MRQCDRRAVESLQILHHTIQCKQVVDDCSLVDVGFLAVWVSEVNSICIVRQCVCDLLNGVTWLVE